MAEFKVKRCKPIVAEIRVPGDKSISHRSIMIAALSNGDCIIEGFLPSEDCLNTMKAFQAMGVRISVLESNEHGPVKLKVTGICAEGRAPIFKSPSAPVDCGNSGTTMRLMSGILSGQPAGFRAELVGDASLMKRPMARILDPLRAMGAKIEARGEGNTAPIVIEGSEIHPIDYELPVASAQVKSAILFAALRTQGGQKTTILEKIPTRNHTECMFQHFRVKTSREDNRISIYGGQIPESRDFKVPGDISSAAFWVVAAAAMPGAHLSVHGVGLNETRTGILKTLIRMGAQVTEVIEESADGEPIGRIEVHGGRLKGTVVEGEDIPNVIDELPIIAVAGALAEGRTLIRDAQELRVKESDRITSVANNLRLMGVTVDEYFDGMEIHGGASLKAARLKSFGDHRIAMAFAIAGLFATGETVIEDTACVETSYPGFYDELKKKLTGKNEGTYTPVISSLNPKIELESDPRFKTAPRDDE